MPPSTMRRIWPENKWYRYRAEKAMVTTLTEADVEQAALEWLSGLGWQVLQGPVIAP